jgi:type II secretory pathway pseudopilin PulG
MVVLLIGISVMAIMLGAAMPVWKQTVQREKETELVFRGEQYARAIALFQRKMGPGTLPPTIDLLVEQRFLRKKYKDPITNDDFAPLAVNVNTQPGATGQPAAGSQDTGRGLPPTQGSFAQPANQGRGATPGAAAGGIVGVASKSKDKSIRVYKGRTHYNEWQFVYTPPPQAPGAATPGGMPGLGGQRGRGNQGPGGTPFPAGAGRGRGPGTAPDGRGQPFPPGPNGPNAPGRGPFPPGPFPPGQFPPGRSGR